MTRMREINEESKEQLQHSGKNKTNIQSTISTIFFYYYYYYHHHYHHYLVCGGSL